MQFFKLQATGNDFIFLLEPTANLSSERISHLCDRHRGIGSDGLIVLKEKTGSPEYEWSFYNPDGNEAEMCGNAARCATRLLEKKKGLKTIKVHTRAGFFNGKIVDHKDVTVETTIPQQQIHKSEKIFEQRFSVGYLTNTGVPHMVIPVESLDRLRGREKELSAFIFDSLFGSRGANLTFFSTESVQQLKAVTLERGVNDFTLSCGTGVIAAAQVHRYLQKTTGPIGVQTPGGHLIVDFPQEKIATLTGAAEMVFEGSIS
ncbi:diaminopimelate epimerase [bacterium]|nr:diaminopimelate epimerase [bacterium]